MIEIREGLPEENAMQLCELLSHPETLRHEPDYRNQQDKHVLYEKMQGSSPQIKGVDVSLYAFDSAKLIGFVGVHRMDPLRSHVGDVGIAVHPDYWRRGIGFRLIEEAKMRARSIGMTRLEASVLEGNTPMRRLAEKAGFHLDSVDVGAVDMHGIRENLAYYSLQL